MEEDEIGDRKEKIESKGAYTYDLHEAIRDVRRAFRNGDQRGAHFGLNALKDICAPEIRQAINEEWSKIDEKYHDILNRIENAEFRLSTQRGGWRNGKFDKCYTCFVPVCRFHGTDEHEERIEEDARRRYLAQIWDKILHERLQACIDCLDRHAQPD